MQNMLKNSNLSTTNYSNLLISWSSLTLQPNVTLDAGSIKYNFTATSSRDDIINNFNWTINDGGL